MRLLLLLAFCLSILGAVDEPGHATPSAAAKSGTYRLVWTQEFEGNQTSVVVGSGIGMRSLAVATTKDKDGKTLATYPAVAYLDANKVMHVDGRGAPLMDPHEDDYSPDSFAISPDGTVKIQDDNGSGSEGKLVSGLEGK